MKQPKMIQETLIDDEDLSADIADLVPVSSKITDAAATYIGKVSKKFGLTTPTAMMFEAMLDILPVR